MRTTQEEHNHALKHIPLKTTPEIQHELNQARRAMNDVHNRLVNHAIALLNTLDNDKQYQQALTTYSRCKKTLSKKQPKKTRKKLETNKQQAAAYMNAYREEIGLTEHALQAWINNHRKRKYPKILDVNAVQKEATRVWKGVEKVLFNNSKQVHHRRWDDLHTIGGKSASSGMTPVRDTEGRIIAVKWHRTVIPFARELNEYERQCLENELRYIDIEFLLFPDGYHYYPIFNLHGHVPLKHEGGNGRGGLDPGTSTVAFDSERESFMVLLAPESESYDARIGDLNRRIDQSMRATNPDYFNEDGTYKKRTPGEKRAWVLSAHCRYLKRYRKMLYRKQHESTTQSHSRLANRILSLVDDIWTEEMNYAGLARKAALAVNEKTGRYKKRSRWGKSIGHRVPATFMSILKRKAAFLGASVSFVDKYGYKASQLEHVTGECAKVPLSHRWKVVDGVRVQRDMYASFLLGHALPDGSIPDREGCVRDFAGFLERCEDFVERAVREGVPRNSCFGF